jgi:hypothetical protein
MSRIEAEGRTMPFFELYSRGKVQADEIDDYMDRWHDSADERAAGLTLHEYLGLTKAEYDRWVQAPGSLPEILRTRGGG